MRWRRRTLVLALVAFAGCGDTDDADVAGSEVAYGSSEIEAIVADLNDYWSSADDELGFDYRPIPMSRISVGSDGVLCDGDEIDPAEVEDNAFVDAGCDEGILVAYDPDYVEASLARAESTMAHEWGHVIQAQASDFDLSLDPDGLPIDSELQADCFAGAWAGDRAEASQVALRADVAASGDDAEIDDPHAHGSPEERTAAFDIGLAGGPAACVDELIDQLP